MTKQSVNIYITIQINFFVFALYFKFLPVNDVYFFRKSFIALHNENVTLNIDMTITIYSNPIPLPPLNTSNIYQ